MTHLLKRTSIFLLTTIPFLIVALFLVVTIPKKELHFLMNQNNSHFQDVFFRNFTHFGDGNTAIIIVVLSLFFINYRTFFIGLSSFVVSGVASQILKRVFANGAFRPAKVFNDSVLHYVPGIEMHYVDTFPSGHSATAFALFLFLSYVFQKNNYAQIACGFAAVLVCYSRVYLSQHFLIDTFFGALLGICSFYICAYFLEKSKQNWLGLSFKSILKKQKT